jgi:hypothetical protein
MKQKLNFKTICIAAFCIVTACAFSPAPACDPEDLLKKYAGALDQYVFIKSFPVEVSAKDDKAQYSYVLSRGIDYRIVVGDNNDNQHMVVNLLDRNKKLIATNYLKSSKKFYPTISYVCSATGVYYVEVSFEGEKKGCGINILGFKK